MKKRASFAVACVAALAMCSCASQADLEKLKADAAAARAEAAEAKAAAAEAKTTADALKTKRDAEEKAKADEVAAKERAVKLESELRDRWNDAVGNLIIPLAAEAGPGFRQVGFKWTGPKAFPHPTLRGGSKEAYTAFAKLLVTFLETGDNFEFMQKNDLFTADLGLGETGKIKIVEFASQLAQPGSLGSGDEANRKKLEALVAKMKMPRKV